MGVYQSATQPQVRRKQYSELVPEYLSQVMSRYDLIRDMRRRNRIPARVVPETSIQYGGMRFQFDWWEVETNLS